MFVDNLMHHNFATKNKLTTEIFLSNSTVLLIPETLLVKEKIQLVIKCFINDQTIGSLKKGRKSCGDNRNVRTLEAVPVLALNVAVFTCTLKFCSMQPCTYVHVPSLFSL